MNFFMLSLSQIFGLIPFNRFASGSDNVYDYAVMFVIPVLYVTAYCLAHLDAFALYQLHECNCICKLGNWLFIHLGFFVYIMNYAVSLVRRKNFYSEYQRHLLDIDVALKKCSTKEMGIPEDRGETSQPINSYMRHFSWIMVIGIFSYATYYDVSSMMRQYGGSFFIASMATTFPYFAASVVQGQFIHFVTEISKRFTMMNALFEEIKSECEKKSFTITVYDIVESNVKVQGIGGTKVLEESNKNGGYTEFATQISGEQMYEKTSAQHLSELFGLHEKILALSVLTNEEFAPQVVPYMSVCFVISIFGIFLVAKVTLIVGGHNELLDYVIHVYVIWSVTTMIVAYLMLRLCCNANGQSKQSAMIVHEIMQKKPVFMLGNDLYYHKMKSFTLQFLHWEGYFKFNGIGMFTLDYTFIFSTVSAATSYLIVLLQFDMSAILKSEGLTD